MKTVLDSSKSNAMRVKKKKKEKLTNQNQTSAWNLICILICQNQL